MAVSRIGRYNVNIQFNDIDTASGIIQITIP